MAFRQRRDKWDDFLSRHGDDLRSCGVPAEIVADRKRFLLFLDHGYDDWGRSLTRHGFFDSDDLTDEQIASLSSLLDRIAPDDGAVVRSRWRSSGRGDPVDP